MVEKPKEDNGDQKDTTEYKPPGQKQKQQRRRCSKSSHSKNSDDNPKQDDTPVDSECNNDHRDTAMEQDTPGHAEHSPEQTPNQINSEGRTHHATSKEENSPVDNEFIIPEEHSEQDNLSRKLLATARSLKKQKQRLKAEQDTLNRR